MVQNDLFWPVFSNFLNFGPSDQLHIAYFNTYEWSSRFGYGITHVLHLDHSIIKLRCLPKSWYLVFYWVWVVNSISFVHRIDVILYISVLLNGLNDMIMVLRMFWHNWLCFISIIYVKKGQNEFFPFYRGLWVWAVWNCIFWWIEWYLTFPSSCQGAEKCHNLCVIRIIMWKKNLVFLSFYRLAG